MKKRTMVIMACIGLAVIIAGAAVTLYIVVNKKKPKTPTPQPTVAVTQVQQNAPSADATVIPTEAK